MLIPTKEVICDSNSKDLKSHHPPIKKKKKSGHNLAFILLHLLDGWTATFIYVTDIING